MSVKFQAISKKCLHGWRWLSTYSNNPK